MKTIPNLRHYSRPRTNRLLAQWRPGLLAVGLVAAHHAAMAQGTPTGSEKTDRCVVLGETAACPAPATQSSARIEERIELGSVAKYYVHLGMDREGAIERASAGGEHPVRRLVRVTTRDLTGIEKYEHLMGNAAPAQTDEETVVGTVDRSGCAAVGADAGG